MQDEIIYRCIHAACARQLPRRVDFCPYCGTGQHAGVDKPSHALPRSEPLLKKAPAPVTVASPPRPAPVMPSPPPPPAAKPKAAVKPPHREPIKKRYWILSALLLWGIWLTEKPANTRKIDARIDQAIDMSRE